MISPRLRHDRFKNPSRMSDSDVRPVTHLGRNRISSPSCSVSMVIFQFREGVVKAGIQAFTFVKGHLKQLLSQPFAHGFTDSMP